MTNQTQITAETSSEVANMFALDDLYLSDLNPRQTANEEGIDLLAESLVACGLIQNLCGFQDENGKVAVVAGGRRWRALQIAVKQRPSLAQVPVRLAETEEQAAQWANAENTAREQLEAADEIRAYGQMEKRNMSIAQISQSFGVTEAHVRRRLKLSNLPNPVIDALKAGEISLGKAQAMTVSDDAESILAILEQAKSHWFSEAQIKSHLTPDSVRSTNRKAVFVTEEVYVAAGGEVSKDLFDDVTYFNNPDILDRLFAEKLEDVASGIQKNEGWAWVEINADSYVNWYELQRESGFSRTYAEEGVLDETQTERYDELDEQRFDDDLTDELKAELDVFDTILEGTFSDKQKGLSGVIVYVDHSGNCDKVEGLVMTCAPKTPPSLCRVRPTKGRTNEGTIYG